MFEQIYCINLESRPDRWLECKDEFEKHSIEFVQRVDAFTGDQVLAGVAQYFPIKPGEAGLVKTHESILRDAIENNFSSILILEDDIQFADTIHECLDSIPENWDVVYFGGNHAWGQPKQINDKIAIANKTLAMHCVGIKNTVYQKMLDRISLNQPIDVTYANNLYFMNSYVFVPSQAWQRPSWSDLMGQYTDYGFLK